MQTIEILFNEDTERKFNGNKSLNSKMNGKARRKKFSKMREKREQSTEIIGISFDEITDATRNERQIE
jgi:hypothetical protein